MFSSDPLLELNDVSLSFRVNVYRSWTLRDFFVSQLSRKKKETSVFNVSAAKNVSLRVFPGERVGIIGANGAGKTSLCRCIAGIYRPDSGSIRTRGQVRAIFHTGIGIYPELTGRENLYLLSQFLFPEERDRDALVQDSVDFSGIGDLIDMPFRLYSSGMQSRLYLSLVSFKPADIFILDEVFDGADMEFSRRIAKRMQEMMKNSGAVLFVSHAPDQLEKVCSRAVVLEKGELVFDGSVSDARRFYEEVCVRGGKV